MSMVPSHGYYRYAPADPLFPHTVINYRQFHLTLSDQLFGVVATAMDVASPDSDRRAKLPGATVRVSRDHQTGSARDFPEPLFIGGDLSASTRLGTQRTATSLEKQHHP
ncbi:hypothetical protein HBI56_134690 [Parastagonospora nodorum]|uniref:Uncharacterized protein n=1 Tax=Phaeosphaeria nodorum (strain SN15 / ATCC MYA-4574 / FGSC 10173) TaxID=321614 RepID=A0A7U2I1J9_PHANO|nr:hypothetical protein HBH56_037790 [Parastagonospora nodorum]QRC99915.1 hypothetical protein JI435_068410 [Parastagonospora nodorum SN15]KAH3933692.1 hypothetical protein HBH54_061670 [Parastagonospora nodorum]KAH3952632.1 hypothetical protein HBH53_048440 [Parastagonospora nodorum]KAH3979625.1 hypothetical protein HBH51_059440 [Parastagonospora nodorum]